MMKRGTPSYAIVLLGMGIGCALGERHHYLRRVAETAQEPIKCLALKRITEFASDETDRTSEEHWDCELPDGSILTLEGLDKLHSPEITQQFESGVSELTIPGGVIHDDSIVIPPDASILVEKMDDLMNPSTIDTVTTHGNSTGNIFEHHHRRLMSGHRKVLVIKVTDSSGASISSSAKSLSSMLFSANGQNFVKQFRDCSYGKLTFGPTKQLNGNDPALSAPGVYEVTIPMKANKTNELTFREAVSEKLREEWKDTLLLTRYGKTRPGDSSPFDHVFYCLPPGTIDPGGAWIAYGYEGGWLTVYNDVWCTRMSAHMHELGHNLAIHHSGDMSDPAGSLDRIYGDQSGYMGSLYGKQQPKMCYNSVKSFKLGWYQDKTVLVSPSTSSWSGRLHGIADYGMDWVKKVLVKVETGKDTDYYVAFNRKTGINSETKEGGDQVLITTEDTNGVGYKKSSLVAKLSKWQTCTISNFGGSGRPVTIAVGNIKTAGTSYADVTIEMGCSIDSHCENDFMFACPSYCNLNTNTCETKAGCDCDGVCNDDETPWQCPSDCSTGRMLETTKAGAGTHGGSMFDVKAKQAEVEITGFEINAKDAGTYINAYVYTRVGGYQGFESDGNAWKHIHTARVKCSGENEWTKLPDLPNPILIPPGKTQAFYVTLDVSNLMRYTTGQGAFANDDFEVAQGGVGKSTLFSSTTVGGRSFNGRINYVNVEPPPIVVTTPTTPATTTTKAAPVTTIAKRKKKKKKRRRKKKKRKNHWWWQRDAFP